VQVAVCASKTAKMEKRPTEHRRLAEMHKQLYPSVNTDLTPIPSQWTIKEPQNRLELSGGNLIVAYIGMFDTPLLQCAAEI
jgi:hypothetical protein